MMGSGKSTIGKRLAYKLNMQFYDSDKVIEEREGLSVLDIFEFRGEDYFRQKEIEIIKEIIGYGNVVLSTGGGSFVIDEVRDLVKETAVSIWLKTDIATIHERVSRRNTRPLLSGDNKLEIIQKLSAERDPIYEKADIIVESSENEIHYVVDTILIKLKSFLDQQ